MRKISHQLKVPRLINTVDCFQWNRETIRRDVVRCRCPIDVMRTNQNHRCNNAQQHIPKSCPQHIVFLVQHLWNNEKIVEYRKQYYINNKEKISEKTTKNLDEEDLSIEEKYDDFKELEMDLKSNNIAIKVVGIVFVIILIIFAVIFVNKYFNLGLF